jgi:hypothetical protein
MEGLPFRELILDGEVTWDRTTTYHVFDVVWIDGATSGHCRSTSAVRS